jgi:regulator of sigma E protease
VNSLMAFVVVIGILIAFHEYGHYKVARLCGVRVIRFSIGFGRPIFRWRNRDDVEFVVAMIPLGGYVRMLDSRNDPVDPDELKHEFNQQSVWARFAIVAAGPIANFIVAVFAWWLMFAIGFQALAPEVGNVMPGSPAEVAGFESGTRIQTVDGHKVHSWRDVQMAMADRLGETGVIDFQVTMPGSDVRRHLVITIEDWLRGASLPDMATDLGMMPILPDVPAQAGRILEGSPSDMAGFEPGDELLRVDGIAVRDWYDWVAIVREAPGQVLQVELSRHGDPLTLALQPGVRVNAGQKTGYVGMAPASGEWPERAFVEIREGVFGSIPAAMRQTWDMSVMTLDSLGKMLTGRLSLDNLGGPITIARAAGASAEAGFASFLNFMALLSVSLGVLNLLPVPVLDGGHLVFYLAEILRGKPVSEAVQAFSLRIGMGIMLALMGFALLNDVVRLGVFG